MSVESGTESGIASGEAIAADAIEILARLIGFDTVSSKSNLALIDYVEAYLHRHGVDARRVESPDGRKANLIATMGPTRERGILLSGHTDVVPVDGQDWSSDPFILTRRGDRLYGRGTADMKSFLALALAAVPHLMERDLNKPIHLAFSYDEEVGCLGAPDLIRSVLADGHHPLVAIIGEPTGMTIVNRHKGIHLYEVIVTGREAHSSLVNEGVSANMAAIDILSVLGDIAEEEKRSHRDESFEPAWSTLTIGTIRGGTAPNILARECRFTFDVRTLPSREIDDILELFWAAVSRTRGRLADQGIESGVVVNALAHVPSLKREADGEAEAVAAMLSGCNMAGAAVSYGAEAGQFQAAGVSAVICGPGSIVQAHRADEYIDISQIESGAAFMRRLIAFVEA